MKPFAIDQRLVRVAAVDEAIEVPPIVDHADFEQHPVVAARLLEMEPALRCRAAVGAEDRLPGECLGAGQRMDVHQQRIVDAAEFNGFPDRRFDHPRVAEHRRLVAADAIEPVEGPHLDVVGCGREIGTLLASSTIDPSEDRD